MWGGVGEGGKRVIYGGLIVFYFREMVIFLIVLCFGNWEKFWLSELCGFIYMMSLI